MGSKIAFISIDKLRLVVAVKPQLRTPHNSFSMDVFAEKSRLGAPSIHVSVLFFLGIITV